MFDKATDLSAVRNLAGKTAYYGLSSILALCLMACEKQSPTIVGRWLPTDSLALSLGAFEEYFPDSSFVRRINSSTTTHGTFWVREDSIFELVPGKDSMFIELDSLPTEIFATIPYSAKLSGKMIWHDQDTVIIESGPANFKARNKIVRVKK